MDDRNFLISKAQMAAHQLNSHIFNDTCRKMRESRKINDVYTVEGDLSRRTHHLDHNTREIASILTFICHLLQLTDLHIATYGVH